MTVQTFNHYRIVAQYNLKNEFSAFVKPYKLRQAFRNDVGLYLQDEPLPEADHFRVEMTIRLEGKNDDGLVYFASSTVEAIVVLASGMEPKDITDTLRTEVAASLLGSLRSNVSTLFLGTGLPPLVLPPLEPKALSNLPKAPAESIAPPPSA